MMKRDQSKRKNYFFKKWAILGLFRLLVSNPRPSVIKSPPITTRPGLPPGEYLFEMIFELCCILLQQSRATILLSTFDVFNIGRHWPILVVISNKHVTKLTNTRV